MQGDEEDLVVVLKHVLRPVSMMYVPVHNRNPSEAKDRDRMGSRHRDIVDEAKAHGEVALRMVARGTH